MLGSMAACESHSALRSDKLIRRSPPPQNRFTRTGAALRKVIHSIPDSPEQQLPHPPLTMGATITFSLSSTSTTTTSPSPALTTTFTPPPACTVALHHALLPLLPRLAQRAPPRALQHRLRLLPIRVPRRIRRVHVRPVERAAHEPARVPAGLDDGHERAG